MYYKLTGNELKVLSVLSISEMYGHEIVWEINKGYGGDVFPMGTIYNLLETLERKHLIESKKDRTPTKKGGNNRKYCKLTILGERILKIEQQVLLHLWTQGN